MNFKEQIRRNTEEIERLHARIHETFAHKHESREKKQEWEEACKRFHDQYPKLCFYNGIEDYRSEIRAGNQEAIEYSICFLEVRPYFFRSGYIYTDLIRVLKKAEMTESQKARYNDIRKRYKQHLQSIKDE